MKLRPFTVLSVSVAIVVLTAVITPGAPAALKSSTVSSYLKSAVHSKALANPGMVLLDPVTGEIIFENSANSLRKPASLLKLLTATAILNYVNPDFRFTTEILTGAEPNTLMIAGSSDPWMERNNTVATKMGRVSLPALVKVALKKLDAENGKPVTRLNIEYANIYSGDLDFIQAQFKARHIRVTAMKVTSAESHLFAKESIAKFESPPLQKIIDWMLLWSDNVLGDRLARLAALHAGFGYSKTGVQEVFVKTLTELNISVTGLNAVDGSGLSKSDRVSAHMMAQLLLKTYKSEKYQYIYNGLPIGGVSGTLRNRFIKIAPSAIGLVRAKTGTLNGTVGMAGYVQGGDHEYIFVVIADQIPKGSRGEKSAHDLLDKVIAKFAKPIPFAAPNPSTSPSQVVENLDGTGVASNPSS